MCMFCDMCYNFGGDYMAKKKSKKKEKRNKFSLVISCLFFVLSCVLVYFLMTLKILPSKYFLSVVVALLIVNLILFLALIFSNKIFIKVLSILGCLGLFYGIYSISNTSDILNSMNINYKTSNYVVLVNVNSKYNKIEDLTNKNIGYLSDDESILNKIKISYQKTEYNDVNLMSNNLLDNKLDGIILEQSYVDMLSEEDSPIKDFKNKVRVIYDFKVNTKITDISKDVNTTSDTFCIYISGIDTYGEVSSVSRTDANMVVVVNPTSKQILMLSIPRDYYIDLYGKDGKDKLTHSGIYGIDTTVKSIEQLLDIDINYYYKINFTSLINIVNAIDGVDVYSKYTFTSKDGYNYQKGYNHVNGKEALSFARERKAFSAGDRIRNINQQALVEAIFRKCTDSSIIVKYNSLLNSLKKSFVTNMPSESLTSLIKMQLNDNVKWNITSASLDGTNAREFTYSYKSNKLYVMIPDQTTITNAQQMINDVKSGKQLDSSYANEITNIKNVTKTQKSNKNSNTTKKQPVSNIIKEYTITYIIDDTKEVQKVKENSILTNKKIPEKEGYKIIGWYVNDKLYDFTQPISSDLVLTAKYEKVIEEGNIIEDQIQDGIIDEDTDLKSNINEKDIIP